MAAITIHSRPLRQQHISLSNPLPQLLQTPSGLALLELQGTIHVPDFETLEGSIGGDSARETAIGRLIFPDYHPGSTSTDWMKRVYLYVGKHQRLTGQVKKLPKSLAVIRKLGAPDDSNALDEKEDHQREELEIVEIIKWKILFSQRPEPVGTWNGET